MTTRAEARRIRRGRQPSEQQGQGHGNRTYVPVRQTNRMVTNEGKLDRQDVLADRALQDARKRAAIMKRVQDKRRIVVQDRT